MKFAYVELELTRRCNTKCAHCMRGDMQPVDMETEDIGEFMSNTTNIHQLILTGGEVSLVPHKIDDVLSYASILNVNITHLTVVTNGLTVTDKFLSSMDRATRVAKTVQVLVSVDAFRKPAPEKNIEKLIAAKIFAGFKSNPLITNAGRAKGKMWASIPMQVMKPYWVVNGWVLEPVYLNAKGKLVLIDGSYEEQEAFTLGSVYDMSYELFMQWNVVHHNSKFGGINGNWPPQLLSNLLPVGPPGPTYVHKGVVYKHPLIDAAKKGNDYGLLSGKDNNQCPHGNTRKNEGAMVR